MRLSVVLAALLLAPCAAAQGAEHLIGRPDAGLPGGWAEVSGSLLQDLAGGGPDHTLSLYANIQSDDSWLVVYTRIDSLVRGRYPVGTVVAALQMELEPGEVVAWPGCISGRDVVAIAGMPGDPSDDGLVEWGPVRLAWELDPAGGAFRPLEVEGFACEAIQTDE